jgi:DNA polymerase-3 subunit alpha
MDSVSYYFGEHELQNINYSMYGLSHFSDLPENPVPIRFFKHYPIYNICQIAGTVLGKNKIKSTITLLDSDGSVILVKFRKEFFNIYDKQISEKQEDGSKKVIEKSWFKRGNKLIIAGYRRENEFIPKTYSSTPFRTLYNIIDIKDNQLLLREERLGE